MYIFLLCVLSACSPDVVFVADPLLGAVLPSRDSFEREMSRIARDRGARIEFAWPETELLDQLDYASILEELETHAVVLSPYASLFSEDLSRQFPDHRIVAMRRDSSDLENLTSVQFDWFSGWLHAGEIAGQWMRSEPDRTTIMLTKQNGSADQELGRAFRAGVEAEGGTLDVEFIEEPIQDEAILNALTGREAAGETLVVLMLGRDTAAAAEVLRDQAVLLGLPGAYTRVNDTQTVFSVRIDLPTVLSAHLASPAATELLVPAVVDLNTRIIAESEQSE